MKLYKARAGPEFPYIKGGESVPPKVSLARCVKHEIFVSFSNHRIILLSNSSVKSHLREILDDMMDKTKVKLNYELPENVVEDHTYEVVRLKFKVT